MSDIYMLNKLLQQYADKFKDTFPIFYVRHLEEKEIADLVKKAIHNNEPFIADYKDGAVY